MAIIDLDSPPARRLVARRNLSTTGNLLRSTHRNGSATASIFIPSSSTTFWSMAGVPLANANFKKPVTHQVFYNPQANQRGNEVMRWQQGGYDMEYRMQDNAREGIDFQFIFPPLSIFPRRMPARSAPRSRRAYNNWTHKLVAGHRDRLSPVAMIPAGLSGRNGQRITPLQ